MPIKMFKKRHPPVGSRPGTLVIEPGGQIPDICVMDYTPEAVVELEHVPPSELRSAMREEATTWVDVRGLADEAILRAIGDVLKLHPLALEDVVNAPQRPKSEPYDEHQLVILRMGTLVEGTLHLEQVGFLIGPRYVATFQERDGDVFDPIRTRIRQGRGPIRSSGASYLAYALIDTIIDAFYPVLEALGDELSTLDEEVVAHPSRATLRRIHAAKRRLLALRRAVWPHRDVINALLRDDLVFIDTNTRLYLRDTYDHAVQQLDVLESYRESASGLLDVYLSSESNRTNEVMRTLTVTASIFIPLTFIAGVYGMNFEGMPELHSRIGYPLVIAAMLLTAGGLLWKFRKLGWIGSAKPEDDARRGVSARAASRRSSPSRDCRTSSSPGSSSASSRRGSPSGSGRRARWSM